jgi:hypothetical protein
MSRHQLRNLLRRMLARLRYGLGSVKPEASNLAKRPTYLRYIED